MVIWLFPLAIWRSWLLYVICAMLDMDWINGVKGEDKDFNVHTRFSIPGRVPKMNLKWLTHDGSFARKLMYDVRPWHDIGQRLMNHILNRAHMWSMSFKHMSIWDNNGQQTDQVKIESVNKCHLICVFIRLVSECVCVCVCVCAIWDRNMHTCGNDHI